MSKLAVIDLGTGSIKILIGSISQEGYTVLYEENVPCMTSASLPIAHSISLKEKKLIIDILVAVKQKLDIDGVEFIIAAATSLLREAPNAAEVIIAIKHATGIEVKVISGVEEADLIYLGVCSSLSLIDETGLIVDIGGGSVECIIFNHKHKLWDKSFKLGVRRVASQFTFSDFITPIQVDIVEGYFRTVLAPLFGASKMYQPIKLIGSAGFFRTLRMLYKCHAETIREIKTITVEQFYEIYPVILTTPAHVWQQKVSIEPIFLKCIPLSTILINLIIRTCNLQEIIISNDSLKKGLFIREWHRLKHERLI